MNRLETKKISRGLRNNNPGNIRINPGVNYMGEVSPSQDKAFKQFSHPKWGYRAMFVVLHTYQKRYGLSTVEALIDRYAPAVENDTDSYAAAVARECALKCNQTIDTLDGDVMRRMVAAMSRVENGRAAVAGDVEQGWQLFVSFKP